MLRIPAASIVTISDTDALSSMHSFDLFTAGAIHTIIHIAHTEFTGVLATFGILIAADFFDSSLAASQWTRFAQLQSFQLLR